MTSFFFFFLLPFYLTLRTGLHWLLQTLLYNAFQYTHVFGRFFSTQIMLVRGILSLSPDTGFFFFFSLCNFMMWHSQCVFYPRQCSSSCAGGVQHRVVVCQDEDGRSASYCDAASRPPEAKHCDSGPCPRWSYGSWGEVSHTVF